MLMKNALNLCYNNNIIINLFVFNVTIHIVKDVKKWAGFHSLMCPNCFVETYLWI